MLFLITLLVLAGTAAAIDPISCTNVSYTGYYDDSDQFNLTASANFALSTVYQTTYFTVSNVSVYNSYTGEYATGLCYYSLCCNITTTPSCTFDVRDAFVILYANFTGGVAATTFTGLIADNGTFSTTHRLFYESPSCFSSASSENTTKTGNTVCCTAATPAAVAPPNSPKCKQFFSRTTIYNTNDHFSIFATTSIVYNIVGRTIIPSNLTDTKPANYFVCYFDHTFFNNPLV